MSTTQGERITRLEEKVSALTNAVTNLVEEMRAANVGRKEIYKEQEALRSSIAELGYKLGTVQTTIDQITPTTVEYQRIRDQVTGAGTLGRWAWRIGSVVLAGAGWAVAAYTALTGRPPP